MFEGILEKMLLAKLGKYIVGLDKDNLKVGVWGGDIALENVHLKPNALLLLQLPFLIKFGKIVKLVLKVPWAKLSSAPVEVRLEGLYIIISSQEQNQWEHSEEGDIINRKELIEAYEQRRKQLQEQKLLSAEEELKEKSFLEKMTSKVIDNLKFTIQDIHIRLENNLDGRIFAGGITLEKIECFTTNSEWNSEFTDRHKSGSANLSIYKLLSVISLGLYWKTGEGSFDVENDEEITEKMKGAISNENHGNYLIAPINAQAKIVHSSELINFEVPQYMFNVELPEITVIYKQLNFHDTVKLFEYFAEYQQFLLKIENRRKFQMMMPIERTPRNRWKGAIKCIISTIRHRKDRSVNHFIPSPEIRKFYEGNFKMLHRKLKKTNKYDDEPLYNRIILLTSMENLYTWVSHVQSVIEKEAKAPEKKPAGFSGLKFWEKKPANEPVKQVPVEESYEKIFSEIESIPLPQYTLLPKSYARVRMTLNLGSGVFKLLKTSQSGEECLIFTYSQLFASASFKVEGMDVSLSMQDLSLSSYSKGELKTIVKKVDCEEPLWKLNFCAKPNDLLAWRLENYFQSLEIDYSLDFLTALMSFFVVPKTHESAKIAAWDTIKGIQNTTSEALSDLLHGESLYELKFYSAAPKIRFGSPTKQGDFFLSLGDILVQNQPTEDHYEDFEVHLSSLGLKYRNSSGFEVDVVTEFEISSLAKILKSKYKLKPKQPEPEIIIESSLPKLEMFWNSSIFNQLQRLPELFNYEIQSQPSSSSECKFSGNVQKLTTGLHAWKDCKAALVSSYLYFFTSESYTSSSSSFFYIKDCSLDDVSSELNKEYCLKLHNIYGECIFSVESKIQLEQWKFVLHETINEYESRTSMAAKKTTTPSQTIILKYSFQAPKTIIHLTNDRNETTAEISLSGMQSYIIAKECEHTFDGTLGHMEISEGINSRFSKLFASKETQDLISLKLQHIDSKSMNYQGKDFIMDLKCGEVEVNWNYNLMVEVLNFFQFAEYSDPKSILEEKVGTVDKDHVLLDFNIGIQDVTIFLNNNKTQVTIAGISVKNFSANFLMKNEGLFLKGTLGNLEISELTNYPATSLGKEIVPFQLFSVRDNNSLMTFSIIIFSDNNKAHDKDISSEIEVELNSVNIVYLHQPIMRIVDYLNYHVLGVFDTQNRLKNIDMLGCMIKRKFIEEKLGFTSICVKIQNPIMIIPPRPGYANFFALNLGIITVKNRLEKANNPGWVDIFDIQMVQVNIFSTSGQIAEEFDVSLEVRRKLLTTKHLEIPNLDKAYRIYGKCHGIKMDLSQRDYNLIIRTADLNILYDDQLESYISPSYKYQEHIPGEFLTVDFDISLISILFTLEKIPIAELLCLNNTIKIIKYNDTTIEFNLQTPNAIGLIGENSVKSTDANFKQMADEVFSVSYDSLCDFYDYSEFCRLKYILFGPVSNQHEKILNVHLRTDIQSTKEIKVDIGYIRINFHLAMFNQILAYVTSGIPNYTASIEDPQDYIKRYRPKPFMLEKEALDRYLAPKIVAKCNLTKSFIVLPSFRKVKTLVAYADLNFLYIRESEGVEGPDVITRLILENFQIFHAKYEELLNYLGLQPKRKVLEAMEFIFEAKEMKKSRIIIENYVIGSLKCALSYRDLMLIQSSYRFQEEMLNQDNSIIKTLEGFSNIQILEDKVRRNSGSVLIDFITNDKKTCFSFAGLNIILINDALTAYTPILDFTIAIGDQVLTKTITDGDSSFLGTLQIWCNYYNPIVDDWEPFIEGFHLDIEIISKKGSNIQTQYVLSVNSEFLNVNFSEVMIKNIQDILAVWDSNSTECSEVISHFQIKNETGYSILVQYKYTSEVSVIENGNTVDHIIDYYTRDKNPWKSDSITVSIFPGDFQPPKLRIKTNKVQSSIYHSAMQYVVVDVELCATRKTLTVRSPVIIENNTNFEVKIVFHKSKKSEIRECLPGNACPVPYDFILGSMALEIYEYRSSSLLNLEELWKKGKNNSTEVAVGDIHLCLFYKISKHNSKKRTLFIKPTLAIHNCLPCQLSLRIYNGRPSKFDEILISQSEKIENYLYSLKSDLAFSIGLDGFSRSNVFPLLNPQHPTTKIKIADRKQQELTIFIYRIQDGTNTFMFYVSQVFINNSLNPIAFYHKQDTSFRLLPGQNFINTVLPSNTTKKILIGLGNTKSRSVKIDTVGIKDIIELIGDTTPAGLSAKYQYTLDVQITKVLYSEMVYTKVVVISPRFLIVNNTKHHLIFAQDGLLQYGVNIQPGARIPFHWTDKDCRELVRIKCKGEEWAWSGPFPIDNLASFTVQSKNKSELSSFLMVKVDIKIISTTAHIVFEEELIPQASYRLENNSSNFSLVIYQQDYPEDSRYINSMSSCLFTWSNLMHSHEVLIEFLLGKTFESSKDTNSMYKINLDKLNQFFRIKIKDAPKDFDILYASVYNEGPSRVLKFSDMLIKNPKDKPDVILTYYNITIPKLGISVIEHVKHKSKELFYLTLNQSVLLAQNTEKQYKAELMIKDIQGDNQMSPDAIYPVFLHSAESSTRNMLHMCTVLNKNASVNCYNFETFEFLLQTLCLKIDTVGLSKILEMGNRLFLKEQSIEDLSLLVKEFNDPFNKTDTNLQQSKTYYFSFLKIHPIKIIVSHIPLKDDSIKSDLLSGIGSFGIALSTIEAAPVKFYSIQLSDVFASEKRLKESLKSHYKNQLMNEFYSLIGHSNILGNPIGLLRDLGTGVADFFYEPAQGIVNGPISATEGLLKGTHSLLKNTVTGTFGTVSKLTSSLTNGLAVLTQDKDYINERQIDMAKNKPSNVVTGVGLGMLSFIKNIGQGISGVVTEPIKGYKKDSVGGMVKGSIKGIGGLVVKPIAGALDMVSRSAEGIKNTASMFDKTTEYSKERLPRVIYGSSHLIQVYNIFDSGIIDLLYRIKKNKYMDKEFLEQIHGQDLEGRNIVMVFFTDITIYININKQQIMWKVQYVDVRAVDIYKGILYIKALKKRKEIMLRVEFKNSSNISAAEKKLLSLLQLTKGQ